MVLKQKQISSFLPGEKLGLRFACNFVENDIKTLGTKIYFFS